MTLSGEDRQSGFEEAKHIHLVLRLHGANYRDSQIRKLEDSLINLWRSMEKCGSFQISEDGRVQTSTEFDGPVSSATTRVASISLTVFSYMRFNPAALVFVRTTELQ